MCRNEVKIENESDEIWEESGNKFWKFAGRGANMILETRRCGERKTEAIAA